MKFIFPDEPGSRSALVFSLAALFIVLTCSATAQEPGTKKPPVGVPKEARLFNGKWYHVYLEARPWKSARDKSTQLGGNLAVVPDEQTHTFIRTLSKGLVLWLGATDEKVEGLWVWVDGTEMKFKAWDRDQPDNKGHKEHYLLTWRGGVWNDAAENEKSIVGFICEWRDK